MLVNQNRPIGFMMTSKEHSLEASLVTLHDYIAQMEGISDGLLAFSLQGVDANTQTVKGYLYQAETKQWEKGIYSYPASFMIKCKMISSDWKRHFLTVLGPRFFNDFYLGKWDMYKILGSKPEIINHLPETILYQQPSDILDFMTIHPDVYIKPIHSARGYGIINTCIKDQGFLFRTHVKGSVQEKYFSEENACTSFLSNMLRKNRYIIQRTIPPLLMDGRKVDFRVLLVKNDQGKWEDMALVGRCGMKGSFVSNISSRGTLRHGYSSLIHLLGLSKNQALQLRKQISKLACSVGDGLDQSGLHCGFMGIDIGIDHNHHIWIFEIQHYHPSLKMVRNYSPSLYSTILRKQMLYLKWLACKEPTTEN